MFKTNILALRETLSEYALGLREVGNKKLWLEKRLWLKKRFGS